MSISEENQENYLLLQDARVGEAARLRSHSSAKKKKVQRHMGGEYFALP